MRFTKAHGLGNDFVIIDDRQNLIQNPNALAKRLCDRRQGIGADGLMLVQNSSVCDTFMRIYNSDGSEAEMCGNGIRCFAKYVYDNGIIHGERFSVETLAGRMEVTMRNDDGPWMDGRQEGADVSGVTIGLGKPFFKPEEVPVIDEGEDFLMRDIEAAGRTFTVSVIRLGPPHAAVFVDDITAIDVERHGRAIENHPLFPSRVNANFAQVVDENTVIVRTWERGAGATYACGTGSSSVAVCCALAGKTERSVDISLMIGTLHVDWAEDDNVYMTGPAEIVFTGEISL